MFTSDPNWRQLGFFGQYGQTETQGYTDRTVEKPYVLAPTGRLREAAPYLVLNILWAEEPAPDPEVFNLSYFKDIMLIRDPIRNPFALLPDDWLSSNYQSAPWPKLVYSYPHWMSNKTPLDVLDLPDHNSNWFLYYGNEVGLTKQNLNVPWNFPQPDTLWVQYDETDSNVEDANPNDIDTNSMTQQGWGLHLIARKPEVVDPPDISLHYYVSYKLMPTDDEKSDESLATTLLDLRRTSQWKLIRNPLGYPDHHIELKPFQA